MKTGSIAVLRALLRLAAILLITLVLRSSPALAADTRPPVQVGFDGAFGATGTITSEAIKYGLDMAIDEINAAGGVLGGRRIELVVKDNRANPARGKANMQDFAAMPEVVAVFGGAFSTVMLESLGVAHEARINLLLPWSSADELIDNGRQPNYAFRIGIHDDLSALAMLSRAREHGYKRIGLMVANSGWGRSNMSAFERHLKKMPDMKVVGIDWHNAGTTSLIDKYDRLQQAGAQTIILVMTGRELGPLLREIGERLAVNGAPAVLPLLTHGGGVVGWRLFDAHSAVLKRIDLCAAQSFSLFRLPPSKGEAIVAKARKAYGIDLYKDYDGPVGFANAYDLMHILARAIDLAGSAERSKVRDALENVRNYDGLMRRYARPFEPGRHEAASLAQIVFTRFRADGVLVPADGAGASRHPPLSRQR
ncbi:MAG TPA: ABC transporter substrate-binding protein [Accumulibacter sp.]|uniref:ABC transporter substrate-binding protein n=1 Tax=Accumulibacter sp. TaxID=2053492 RepID=UPI002C8FEFFC|nr:ABC transporter substrate-binding protein [Accumulibacter sp.]HNB69321.1 ABC transporter substrate-binding protein [Accumulibacter sp.]HND40519.1 ABC transporter substrate-binding protein [Accumulibacter sp.]